MAGNNLHELTWMQGARNNSSMVLFQVLGQFDEAYRGPLDDIFRTETW